MNAHHLKVGRSARFHTLGDVDGPFNEVWYALHGYGQLAERFLSEFEPAASEGRLIVAPEALSRFYLRGTAGRVGASWMTRADRGEEIDDYVEYLDALHAHVCAGRAAAPRVGVLGFSQGAATAARWAVLGASRPAHLVLWGGYLPPDLREEAVRSSLAATRVDLVVGDEDPHLTEPRLGEELARLRAAVPAARTRRFSGGHRMDAELLLELLARDAS